MKTAPEKLGKVVWFEGQFTDLPKNPRFELS
jgi:hypothetical protein